MEEIDTEVIELINAAVHAGSIDEKLSFLSQAVEICSNDKALLETHAHKIAEFLVCFTLVYLLNPFLSLLNVEYC